MCILKNCLLSKFGNTQAEVVQKIKEALEWYLAPRAVGFLARALIQSGFVAVSLTPRCQHHLSRTGSIQPRSLVSQQERWLKEN